jgi:hypothetical protein
MDYGMDFVLRLEFIFDSLGQLVFLGTSYARRVKIEILGIVVRLLN